MMKSNAGLMNEVIERILELSADAHIQRSEVAKDSLTFHNLTGAIAGYGKVLTLLTELQQQEEFNHIVDEFEFSESVAAVN